jgi:hypothetical protein
MGGSKKRDIRKNLLNVCSEVTKSKENRQKMIAIWAYLVLDRVVRTVYLVAQEGGRES